MEYGFVNPGKVGLERRVRRLVDRREDNVMGFQEWGTAPIKCAKRGCGWRGFETELDAEDGRQDMTTQSICPECGCHDYYLMTDKEVAKWERDKAKSKALN